MLVCCSYSLTLQKKKLPNCFALRWGPDPGFISLKLVQIWNPSLRKRRRRKKKSNSSLLQTLQKCVILWTWWLRSPRLQLRYLHSELTLTRLCYRGNFWDTPVSQINEKAPWFWSSGMGSIANNQLPAQADEFFLLTEFSYHVYWRWYNSEQFLPFCIFQEK